MPRIAAPLDVFIINMDRDADRLAKMMAQFSGLDDFRPQRQPGFLATTLPLAVVRKLARDTRQIGALGCFLAHLGAWERIAQTVEGWGLVLEDDVRLVNPARLFAVDIPADADLVFCNDRMDPAGREARRRGHWKLTPEACPVEVVIARKAKAKRGPPGGDGYLLTAPGARRLIAACERDGFGGHVDWRLVRYCLAQDAVRADVAGSWLAQSPLSPRSRGWGELKGYTLRHHIVRHDGFAPSSRRPIDASSRANKPPATPERTQDAGEQGVGA